MDEHSFTFAGTCYDYALAGLHMKPRLRIILLTVVLPATVAGLIAAIALVPGSVEGVYYPFSSVSCQGDQFIEIRDGKVVHYATCSSESSLNGFYENDPSGSPMFRFSSDRSGDRGKPWARAEPYLLGTRFHYLSSGKSEWKWKRILTGKMRHHMSSSTIQEVAYEKERLRITTYDSRFKVLHTSFRPMRAASPTSASSP